MIEHTEVIIATRSDPGTKIRVVQPNENGASEVSIKMDLPDFSPVVAFINREEAARLVGFWVEKYGF